MVSGNIANCNRLYFASKPLNKIIRNTSFIMFIIKKTWDMADALTFKSRCITEYSVISLIIFHPLRRLVNVRTSNWNWMSDHATTQESLVVSYEFESRVTVDSWLLDYKTVDATTVWMMMLMGWWYQLLVIKMLLRLFLTDL